MSEANTWLPNCMLGNLACLLFVVCRFFSKTNFFRKKHFREYNQASNSLDQNQTRQFVNPDFGPDCLQRLSADDTQG